MAACGGLMAALALPATAAEPAYPPQGAEFKPARTLPGDQVHPSVSYGASGGFLVWQDSAVDGDGTGIAAVRLSADLTPVQNVFRVNARSAGNQDLPKVAKLTGGGAAFVWQGDADVFARFTDARGVFTAADDVMVNTDRSGPKVDPAVVPLADGGALVLWGSHQQDDAAAALASQRAMQGVYGQRFDARGAKVGGEFRLNQSTRFNQRSVTGALLSDGNVVVAWVHEDSARLEQASIVRTADPAAALRQLAQVEVRARMYGPNGAALGDEFLVNDNARICANPSVAATEGGGFIAAWSEKDDDTNRSWEIYARSFAGGGIPEGTSVLVNGLTYGDQFGPSVASIGTEHLVVWTSLGQDGYGEGVFGRLLSGRQPAGPEFRANTTVINKQMHPVAAADPTGGFGVVWTGFMPNASFDLFAQRYLQGLPRPPQPFVAARNQSSFSVSWPELAGYSGVRYAVYAGQGAPPVIVDGNRWVSPNQFVPASTHAFRLAYVFPDGRLSPLSPEATGRTWGVDDNGDGLPDDWQTQHFGIAPALWPSPQSDGDGDGASTIEEFRAGTDPTKAASVLRMRIAGAGAALRLEWNTRAGGFYQVECAASLTAPNQERWQPVGGPRFAPGTADAVEIGVDSTPRYYRVNLLR
ncbi:MAG: hypothetical protein ACKVYV_18540 [Limisphaerales bacterium]